MFYASVPASGAADFTKEMIYRRFGEKKRGDNTKIDVW